MNGIIGEFKGIPFRRCKCGECPEIYEEGLARKYLTDEDTQVYFSEASVYFIECSECGEAEYSRTLERAIQEWNKKMEEINNEKERTENDPECNN